MIRALVVPQIRAWRRHSQIAWPLAFLIAILITLLPTEYAMADWNRQEPQMFFRHIPMIRAEKEMFAPNRDMRDYVVERKVKHHLSCSVAIAYTSDKVWFNKTPVAHCIGLDGYARDSMRNVTYIWFN
jgi:hypothetical protein